MMGKLTEEQAYSRPHAATKRGGALRRLVPILLLLSLGALLVLAWTVQAWEPEADILPWGLEASAAAENVKISLSPATKTVGTGDIFFLTILVSPEGNEIDSAQVCITYDTSF